MFRITTHQKQISESLWTVGTLMVAGGILDAYTYFQRGKVFAFAVEGNLLFFAWNILGGAWQESINYLVPVLSFFIGAWLGQQLRFFGRRFSRLHWRQFLLAIEILLLLPVPWIQNNLLANGLMAVASALQFHAFRKVRGMGLITLACTGSYRGTAESLTTWFVKKDPAQLYRFISYGSILILFFSGCAIGVFLNDHFQSLAIMGCILLLASAAVLMGLNIRHEE